MSTEIAEETKNITLIERLTDIADAIRSINNTTDKYSIYDMPSKINNIDKNAIFSPQNGSLANWLTVIDLNNVDFSTDKDVKSLFNGCTHLKKIFFPENFGSNAMYMSYMFSNCSALTTLNLSNFNTDKVTSMGSMFYNCKSLTSLDLSNFNTEKVTYMGYMFQYCSALTTLNLSNFDTQSVTDMSYMFSNCKSLTTLDLSNFNTQSVTNMSEMFSNCSALTTLNLSNFDTQSVTNMSYMFSNCSALTTLNLSNFNTDKVTSMDNMFYNCSALTTLNLSNFNAQSVTNMYRMFYKYESLTTVNLSNFNAQNVTDMEEMFYGCSSLTSLDLSNLDTSNISKMNGMFDGCISLTTLTLGNNWGNNTAITKINLSDCPLTHDSCLDVFNKLADKTQTTTTSSVISINSTTKALMSDAEIKIATDKGWTRDNLQKINQNIFSEDSSCNVVFGNDKFIASDGTTLAYSVDGFNWIEIKQNVINKPRFVYYVGNTFFLVGEGALAYSTNGIDWELCNLPYPMEGTSSSLCMSYGNDVFVISYGTTEKILLCYSNNGIDWYSGTVPSSILDNDVFMAVAFGNNMFLATSYNGFIIKSTDGITWNEVANSTDTSMMLIACLYGNGRFVLFGANESSGYKSFYSTDGVTLTEAQTLQQTSLILSGVYANNMFIAGGYGSLICSKDGVNWESIPQGTMNTILSITYGNGMFVLGGSGEDGKSTLAYYTPHNDDSGDSSEIYEIGDTGPAGGYIFYKADTVQTSTYVDSNGNTVEYQWQYLEAAPEDVSTSTVIFGFYRPSGTNTTIQSNLDTSITQNDHSTYNGNAAVGQGRLNTSLLVNAMGSSAYSSSSGTTTTGTYAAKLCDDYTLNGYDDWFLPSIEELRYMYENLKSKSIGTWSDDYWASTEYSGSYSWDYDFNGGDVSSSYRYNLYVRAVRAF